MDITALMANTAITPMPSDYGGRSQMLKIRLQGTESDINWFRKILERHPKVKITEFSDYYRNMGTNRYYRVYVEVNKVSDKSKI